MGDCVDERLARDGHRDHNGCARVEAHRRQCVVDVRLVVAEEVELNFVVAGTVEEMLVERIGSPVI